MTDALVLAGGGANGALEVGAAGVLLTDEELDFKPEILTGTSVGAINAAKLGQYPVGQEREAANALFDLWTALEGNADVYVPNLGVVRALIDELRGDEPDSAESALFDTAPLSALIDREADLAAMRASGRTTCAAVFLLGLGRVVYASQADDDFYTAVKASAAFPGAFPPVAFRDDWGLDGGVREVAPIMHAIELGATRIFAVLTDPPEIAEDPREGWGPIGLGLRSLQASNAETLKNDVALAQKCAEDREIELHVLRPDRSAGDSFDFSRQKNHGLIAWGDEIAREYLASL